MDNKVSQIWLEVWLVWQSPEKGWTWRGEKFDKPNDLHRKFNLWQTYYLFPGKNVVVCFYSRDKISQEIALEIARTVVEGRVIVQHCDLSA